MDFCGREFLLHLNLYSEVRRGQKRYITRVEDYGWSCLVFKIKEKWNRIKGGDTCKSWASCGGSASGEELLNAGWPKVGKTSHFE